MIKKWSKPKSFSDGGTPQPLDVPVDPTSKCTILDEGVRLVLFVIFLSVTVSPLCVQTSLCSFSRWFGARDQCWGWGVEWERVKYRDGDPWNWTLLAGLSGGLWYHYILPCAQGQCTSLLLMCLIVIALMFILLSWLFVHLHFSLSLKEDKPGKVVERVAEKNMLDSAMRAVLEARIQKEMDKRRDKRWVLISNIRWWQNDYREKTCGAILNLQFCAPDKHRHCGQCSGHNKELQDPVQWRSAETQCNIPHSSGVCTETALVMDSMVRRRVHVYYILLTLDCYLMSRFISLGTRYTPSRWLDL